jgi:hypothetical protein
MLSVDQGFSFKALKKCDEIKSRCFLVLISSVTYLGVTNGILYRYSSELRTGNVPSPGYGWTLFSRCCTNIFPFSKLLRAHLPSVSLWVALELLVVLDTL